jgi:hypothetical protein
MSRLRSNRMKRAPARLSLLVTELRSTDRLEICARDTSILRRSACKSIDPFPFVSISFRVQLPKGSIRNRLREKSDFKIEIAVLLENCTKINSYSIKSRNWLVA